MSDESIRAVVVDDEPLARQILREYLARFENFDVIAECANGFEAVRTINEEKPDVVFLDIQMPKLDGFEVLELLEHRPLVVFVTAYDDYALRAFEVHAADYLLKPFSEERMAAVIDHVRGLIDSSGEQDLDEVLADARQKPLARILVRDGSQIHVIPAVKLDYVESDDDYVRLVSGKESFRKQQTIADLESRLDPQRFVRIHRSYIVNVERIDRVELYAKDSRIAILRDGSRIPVSRSGYARLRELL